MKTTRLIRALGFCCLLPALPALAGNWSSGGGEILEHARNPWFLKVPNQNNKVTYCVVKGPDFPTSQQKLEKVVIQTIRWWDRQFDDAHYPVNRIWDGQGVQKIKVRVNSSKFVKKDCSPEVDLSFQFGYLTSEQEEKFETLGVDLTRYVGLTIRTDYSQSLRGKGFIYISPDRGPKAFKGQNTIDQAWTTPDEQEGLRRLKTVLSHELGHVHGLAHSDEQSTLMNGRAAEKVVSKGPLFPYSYINTDAGVFFPRSNDGDFYACSFDYRALKKFKEFFEIPFNSDKFCVKVIRTLSRFSVYAKPVPDAPTREEDYVGTARFEDGGARRYRPLVTVWLPKNQTAYEGIPDYITSLVGPAAVEIQQTGEFVFRNGRARKSIFLQVSPRYTQVGGVMDSGHVEPNLTRGFLFAPSGSGWEY